MHHVRLQLDDEDWNIPPVSDTSPSTITPEFFTQSAVIADKSCPISQALSAILTAVIGKKPDPGIAIFSVRCFWTILAAFRYIAMTRS